MGETKRVDAATAATLADKMVKANGLLAAALGEATAPSGLTPAEAAAVRALGTNPEGLSQSAWARTLGVSRQRAHVVASGLAARGLVTVESSGRSSKVALTPAGTAAAADLAVRRAEALARRLGGLAAADADALGAQLDRLVALLGA